jgi:tRNA/tmRNA/rRNA uracil-C5-methylase (TrmA/RlmC/RlmD family)
VIELEVGPVAHGGHCVARIDGQVVFVRHALPGERVRAVVTERRAGYLRADAVEILEASPDRVEPPCPFARPGACGGCDFQHASAAAQQAMKSSVLREQLFRLAKLDPAVAVQPLADGDLLNWRTRVRYTADRDGRLGLYAHRSERVVPVDRCRIAHPEIQRLPVTGQSWAPGASVLAVASSAGDVLAVPAPAQYATVRERAVDREWTINAGGFWQVHPAAAPVFAATVVSMLAPRGGERVWDLYGGAGLFAAALAPHCGPVSVVESDRDAVAAGRRALAGMDNVRFVAGDVRAVLANPRWRSVDLVVLDPPRAGAGRAVVSSIVDRGPRAVAYVACDPAAFARDVATFGARGYRLAAVRAFDAFPMTHHFETIGLLVSGS